MDYLVVTSSQEWGEWLKKNHDTIKEIWLVFYKKHTGQPSISYDCALDEALCWGWIDSIIKRLDDDSYARKFTPRTNTRKWSKINLKKIGKLIQEGRVTPVGMSKIQTDLLEGNVEPASQPHTLEIIIPPEIKAALNSNPTVWKNFNNLADSYKKKYLGWICSAKKEATRQRRLNEAMELLAQNKKLGLK